MVPSCEVCLRIWDLFDRTDIGDLLTCFRSFLMTAFAESLELLSAGRSVGTRRSRSPGRFRPPINFHNISTHQGIVACSSKTVHFPYTARTSLFLSPPTFGRTSAPSTLIALHLHSHPWVTSSPGPQISSNAWGQPSADAL